jgi:hypothetical protein
MRRNWILERFISGVSSDHFFGTEIKIFFEMRNFIDELSLKFVLLEHFFLRPELI